MEKYVSVLSITICICVASKLNNVSKNASLLGKNVLHTEQMKINFNTFIIEDK